MRTWFTVALTTMVFLPSLATAQFPARVQPGTRVRVWLPERYLQENGPWRRQLIRATVADVSNDTLRVSVLGAHETLAVPRSEIRRLDVSLGPPSRVATAFERAVAFAIAGAIGMALENDPQSNEWPNYRRDWRAAEEGAKWGAAIGAVFGFAFPTERWRRVRLPR